MIQITNEEEFKKVCEALGKNLYACHVDCGHDDTSEIMLPVLIKYAVGCAVLDKHERLANDPLANKTLNGELANEAGITAEDVKTYIMELFDRKPVLTPDRDVIINAFANTIQKLHESGTPSGAPQNADAFWIGRITTEAGDELLAFTGLHAVYYGSMPDNMGVAATYDNSTVSRFMGKAIGVANSLEELFTEVEESLNKPEMQFQCNGWAPRMKYRVPVDSNNDDPASDGKPEKSE